MMSCVLASCTPAQPSVRAVESSFPQRPALKPLSSWQIQYSGVVDLSHNVDVYNIDLFDIGEGAIAELHARDIFVMCYFSAGSLENWRPDAGRFPREVIGKPLEGWPGEFWLDIRNIQALGPVMASRLDLAVERGCDGVDPDNVNGYTNDTGFNLKYEDQLAYNFFLASASHSRNLQVGLKNDLEQVPDLLTSFDWAINEECFTYDECELLLPFVDNGKPVFVIEYELANDVFCPRAEAMNFNAIRKNIELDEFVEPCTG